MKITILTDSAKSWFLPYGCQLQTYLQKLGHDVMYVNSKRDLSEGDICFLLCCTNIVESCFLQMNQHNIVVHASDLPNGKGFSPLQWQILEDKNEVVFTLFEASKEVDAGPYYLKSKVIFNGTELYDELRQKVAEKMIEMCLFYVNNIKYLEPKVQHGAESFYRRRAEQDDEIDPFMTIAQQFNHFRIADNKRFPLYFYLRGKKYYLKIYDQLDI